MLVNPNPLWLVDSMLVEKLSGTTNQWNKPEYLQPITLSNVRFDSTVGQSGTANQRTIDKTGTVFVYQFNQAAGFLVDDSWIGARLTHQKDGQVYTLKSYTTYKQDTTDDVYSYELVVANG